MQSVRTKHIYTRTYAYTLSSIFVFILSYIKNNQKYHKKQKPTKNLPYIYRYHCYKSFIKFIFSYIPSNLYIRIYALYARLYAIDYYQQEKPWFYLLKQPYIYTSTMHSNTRIIFECKLSSQEYFLNQLFLMVFFHFFEHKKC